MINKKNDFLDVLDDKIEYFQESINIDLHMIINFKKICFTLSFENVEELIEFRYEVEDKYKDNLTYHSKEDLSSGKIIYYEFH